MWELGQAVAIAWISFGLGVMLFQIKCKDRHTKLLARGLLALSPFVLTCFGVHATRENQQLAAIVAARKSEEISGRYCLASITRTDLGDGFSVERERYSDGGQTVRLKMSTRNVGSENSPDSTEKNAEASRGIGERPFSMSAWNEFRIGYPSALAIDRRTELGRAF